MYLGNESCTGTGSGISKLVCCKKAIWGLWVGCGIQRWGGITSTISCDMLKAYKIAAFHFINLYCKDSARNCVMLIIASRVQGVTVGYCSVGWY